MLGWLIGSDLWFGKADCHSACIAATPGRRVFGVVSPTRRQCDRWKLGDRVLLYSPIFSALNLRVLAAKRPESFCVVPPPLKNGELLHGSAYLT